MSKSKGRDVASSTPGFVWVGTALGLAFLLLPLVGLIRRVAWRGLLGKLVEGPAAEALRLSLVTSVIATCFVVILGLPLAWVLARIAFKGRSLVRALVMLPMVLPPVVGGVALLGAYGKSNGLLGSTLYNLFGLQLTFSPLGVIVAEALDCDVARLGSAGAKTMAVVLGEVDIYVHAGGMYQWDSAAPIAVASAAGLFTSRIDGTPLVYNRRDAWLPDLVVCQQHLAQQVIDALRAGRLGA